MHPLGKPAQFARHLVAWLKSADPSKGFVRKDRKTHGNLGVFIPIFQETDPLLVKKCFWFLNLNHQTAADFSFFHLATWTQALCLAIAKCSTWSRERWDPWMVVFNGFFVFTTGFVFISASGLFFGGLFGFLLPSVFPTLRIEFHDPHCWASTGQRLWSLWFRWRSRKQRLLLVMMVVFVVLVTIVKSFLVPKQLWF